MQQVPDAMYPPRTGKVVRFAGDSPVEVHTPSAAAAGSEASEGQAQHGVYLHSGASLDGSNLSAAGEEEEEELEEDWGKEGEETWYYGAETYTRGWRHVENQIESQLAERDALQAKMDAQALSSLKLAPVITKKAEVFAKHLREKITKEPEISTQILREWIRDEEN